MNSTTQKIILLIEKNRKRVADEIFDTAHLESYISQCIENVQPINLVFPTLHCKSINNESVFNHLPDAADILAINTLESLIDSVNQIYHKGMQISLVHEGHFYGRVGIVHMDNLLDEYLLDLYTNISSSSIKCFTINNFFPNCSSYDQRRDQFYAEFVPDHAETSELIQENSDYTQQYVNYMCFIKNEFVKVLCPYQTASATKNWIKLTAKEQLRVYIGFSRLVKKYFPDYLRVSALYKTPNELDKLAIELIPGNSNRATPGFNILFQDKNGNFSLEKRKRIDLSKVNVAYFKGGRYPYYKEKMTIPVLLLDFDGVICDNSEFIAYKLIAEMLSNKIKISAEILIKRFLGAKLEAIGEILNQEHQQNLINKDFIAHFRKVYPEFLIANAKKVDNIDTLLTAFKIKYICSSNNKKIINQFLESNNIYHLFLPNSIITINEVARPKPAPDLYQKCMLTANEYSKSENQFIAIEDSISGVVAAKSACVNEIIGFVGASTIIDKEYQMQKLLESGAHQVFFSMAELKNFIFAKYQP